MRAVRLGVATGEDGAARDVLCGEFTRAGAEARWIPFATVRTDPYEQWLGGAATALCRDLDASPDLGLLEDLRRLIDAEGQD